MIRTAWFCVSLALLSPSALAQDAESGRPSTRPRAGIDAQLTGSVIPPVIGVGIGFGIDVGVVLADRFAAYVRTAVAGGLPIALVEAEMGLEYATSQRTTVRVGFGVATSGSTLRGAGSATALQIPLRLSFWPTAAPTAEQLLRGLTVTLELEPGVVVLGARPYPNSSTTGSFSFTTAIAVGHATF